MSLPLQAIRTVLSESSQFISERAELNLPASTSLFPFRKKQRDAVELSLSNAPVVAIAGTPASGKTQVALAALSTAIDNQRSTLIVSPFASTFSSYERLPMPPSQICGNQDYRQSVKAWIVQQVSKPKLDFLPPHWLSDSLFEELQTKRGRQFWLDLLSEKDQLVQIQKLTKAVAEILPTVHLQRQQLLVQRLNKSETLIQQRERLHQDYLTLSDYALEQIVDAVLPNIKIPILCLSDNLEILGDRTFDLVIVEDSHYLSNTVLQTIANRANKIVFLGELTENDTAFKNLFQHLLPSYRIEINENHRLHPDLATKVFPALYSSRLIPYTPPKQKYIPLLQGFHRLTWYDVKTNEQIYQTLQKSIENSFYHQSCVLAFSSELCDQLQRQFNQFSNLKIRSIYDWKGQECDALWVICDKSVERPLNLKDLRLALTRASDAITVIGDWANYKNLFDSLSTDFYFVRDILIKEN